MTSTNPLAITRLQLLSRTAQGLALLVLTCWMPLSRATVYELKSDWSNTTNPNGTWRYVVNGSLATASTRVDDTFGPPGPPAIWGTGHVGWSQSNGSQPALDLQVGDIYGHPEPGFPLALNWTSPVTSHVQVTGSAWMPRDIGRGEGWEMFKNSTLLTSGTLVSGDAFSRATPQTFSFEVDVVLGDVITFRAAYNTGGFGDYIATNFTVTTVPLADQQVFIPWNQNWSYMHPMGTLPNRPTLGGTDVDFNTTWYLPQATFPTLYDGPTFGASPALVGTPSVAASYDSGTGPGPIGYETMDYWGLPLPPPAEFTSNGTTLTTPTSGSRRTAYFRTTFEVPAGGSLIQPVIRYIMDDGGFIYLDGEMIARVNMATTATDTYTQLAANTTQTESQIRVLDLLLPAGSSTGVGLNGAVGNATVVKQIQTMAAGTHTLAFSVHQGNLTSTDLGFAFQMRVRQGIAGTVTNVVRSENGTPDLAADDTFSFQVTLTQGDGVNPTWLSNATPATGSYGVAASFGPYAVSGGDKTILFTDSVNAAETTDVTVRVPPVKIMGTKDLNGTVLNLLTSGTLPSAWFFDEAARQITQNNGGTTVPQGFTSQILNLASISGPVQFSMNLQATEDSPTTNFETTDTFKAELVLNDGVNPSTTVNLISAFDTDGNGVLNLEEFNPEGRPLSGSVDHTFTLSYLIPDNIISAQLVITGNNDSASEVFQVKDIHFGAFPNLRVDSIGAPTGATHLSGQPLTFAYTVRNAGSSSTVGSSWTDRVTLSTNAILGDADDVLLATFRHTTGLAPGASYTSTETVTLPHAISGNYRLILETDVGQEINEVGGETDNFLAGTPFVVTLAPYPDLQVNAITLTPSSLASGGQVTVNWRDINTGTGATAGSWRDQLVIVNTTTGQTLFSTVVSYDPATAGQGAIPPAGFRNRSAILTLPDGPPGAGNLTATVTADVYGEMYEYNPGGTAESNNALATNATATLSLYPDLTVTGLAVTTANPLSGGNVTITWNDANVGNTAAAVTWHDYVRVVNTTTGQTLVDTTVAYDASQTTPGPLPAGSDQLRSFTFQLPEGPPGAGNLQISVTTDFYNSNFEYTAANTAETNNQATINRTIGLAPYPDLLISAIAVPTETLSGQAFQISWTVRNQGTAAATGTWSDRIELSADATAGGDILLGNFPFTGSIAVGQSITRTQTVSTAVNLSGPHYLVATTNANRQIFDLNAANNTALSTSPISVLLSPYPNLHITSVTAPPTAFSSQQTVIQWTVHNRGNGATSAPAWHDDVYLSSDTVLDGFDTYLGQAANPSYLSASESYLNNLTVNLPRGIDGTYYFIVHTDAGNQVYENAIDNDNQAVSNATQITLTPPPDLQVTAINSPSIAFSGLGTTVTWTVTNMGIGQTLESAWEDQIFLSANSTFDGADVSLGRVSHTGNLAPGASYSVSNQPVTLPVGITGSYYFILRTDTGNQVYEHAFEGNNVRIQATPFTVNLTPPPDLEVDTVAAPATALAGRNFTFTYTVTNHGSTATPETAWSDACYLSTDNVLSLGTDLLLGSRPRYGSLDIDQTETQVATYTLPVSLTGARYVIVVSDSANQVFELDNTNNIHASSTPVVISTDPPDLRVTGFAASATGLSGGGITVSYGVRNAGVGDTYTASWSDGIIISTEPTLGAGMERTLTTFSHTTVLRAGQFYAETGKIVSLPLDLASGDYYLFCLTDASNTNLETDETNNASAPQAIHITQPGGGGDPGGGDPPSVPTVPGLTDLRVTTVSAPANVPSGQTLAVTWRVENFVQARTNANYWHDRIYLSTDQTVDGSDVALGTVQHSGALDGGTSYTTTTNFAIPIALQGTYYVIVQTDAYGNVAEGAMENNNTRASTSTTNVTLSPVPDLSVTDVAAPGEAFSGRPFTLSWTVQNLSAGPASGTWFDAVYLSRDQIFDRESDLYIGFLAHDTGLAGGSHYDATSDFSLPQGISGPFYVFVVTDSNGRIEERNAELNNAAAAETSLNIILSPPADLTVGTITIPANALAGQNATLQFTIHNDGSNAAQGSWYDSIYFSSDSIWDIGDTLFGRVQHQGVVNGGASYTGSLTAALPGMVPGNYHVIIRSDILNYVAESNENNNARASLDRSLIDAQALIIGTAAQGLISQGQAVFYRFEAVAGETIQLDFAVTASTAANELFVSYGQVPTRGNFDFASNEVYVHNPSLLMPIQQTGTYYVLAYCAAGLVPQTYSLTAERLPFSIQSVTPSTVGNYGEVTLQISGAQFTNQTPFQLRLANGTTIVSRRTYATDPSTAYVTFDLFKVAPGTYTLQATHPDTHAITELSDAVQVTVGTGPKVSLNVDGALDLRPNRVVPLQLQYANVGDADALAPLLWVSMPESMAVGVKSNALASGLLQLLGLSSQGFPTILPPGAAHSIPIFLSSNQVGSSAAMEVRAILSDDATLISTDDWALIQASTKPALVSDADWAAFWISLRPRIGTTFGAYVQFLHQLSADLPLLGNSARDVKTLFAEMYRQDPHYHPSAQFSGTLLDAQTGAPLRQVELAAYHTLVGSQSATRQSSARTDDAGNFTLAGLVDGRYELAVGEDAQSRGLAFDMNRDAINDNQPPHYDVLAAVDQSGVQLYARLTITPSGPDDSAPTLVQDADGNAHMVWARSGTLWHARDVGGAWVEAAPIPGAQSSDFTAAAAANLVDGVAPGIIVSWAQGAGAANTGELAYSIGRPGDHGQIQWSLPVAITADTVADAHPVMLIGNDGSVLLVFEKVDEAITDDSDLYFSQLQVNSAGLALPPVIAASPAPLARDANSSRHAFAIGHEYKVSFMNLVDAKAKWLIEGSGSKDCKVFLQGAGIFELELTSPAAEGANGGFGSKFIGNVAVSGTWEAHGKKGDCHYYFIKSTLGGQVGGAVTYQLPLESLVSRLPPVVGLPGTVLLNVLRKYKIFKADGGISVRLLLGGRLDWQDTDGPPINFRLPDSGALTADLSAGPWGRAAGKGYEMKLYGNVGMKADVYPHYKTKSVYGQLGIDIKIPFWSILLRYRWTPTHEFSPAGPPLLAAAPGEPEIELIYDPTSDIGTTNDYSDATSHAVLATVATDRYRDSEAVLRAGPDGTRYLVWVKRLDPMTTVGSAVVVAESTPTGWSAPVGIPLSEGHNTQPVMGFDQTGAPLILWAHHSAAGINAASTEAEIAQVLADTEIYFSRLVDGDWTEAARVSPLLSAGENPVLGNGPSGALIAAWVQSKAVGTDLLVSAWDGAAWSAPAILATGDIFGKSALSLIGGQLVCYWSEDGNPDPAITESHIFSSRLDATWSPKALFAPAVIPVAPAPALAAAGTSPTTYFGDPPEECCKCVDYTKQRTEGDCYVRTEWDEKLCIERLVYRPCTRRPADPNDILGPEGFAEARWVPAGQSLSYTIRFENNATLATAPAQQVRITEQLDADFDPRTFRLSDFGFGDLIVSVPANRSFYSTRLDLRTSKGFYVDVSAGIDITTGQAFWTFQTIDPATGEAPADALSGFLPPNRVGPEGEGFVKYSVRPRSTAVLGARLDAAATIVFDTEAPIDTPPIFNTLDKLLPNSAVEPLPATLATPTFGVTWGGGDGTVGSALRNFDVYVAIDDRDYTLWLRETTLTQADYLGRLGQRLRFISVARDNAGNVEVFPTSADAQTVISSGPNTAPILDAIADQVATVGQLLSLTAAGSDADLPTNQLGYELLTGAPDAMQIDALTGLLTWTPMSSQAPGPYSVTVRVSDNATPPLSAQRTFFVRVNTPPVAGPDTAGTYERKSVNISLAKLLLNDADADHDPLTITLPTGLSAHGGTVALTNSLIVYTPALTFLGDDTFSYTLSDGQGGSTVGTVSVHVWADAAVRANPIVVTPQPNGHVKLAMVGIPRRTYIIQASSNLLDWQLLTTLAAGANGLFEFEDVHAGEFSTRFYRLALP